MTVKDYILSITLEMIPEDELVELLEDFGYNQKPSVELLNKAIDEKGDKFARELGKLGSEFAQAPFAQLRYENAVKKLGTNKFVNKVGDDGIDWDKLNQKDASGVSWFNAIMASLATFGSLGIQLWGTGNGTYAKQGDADRATQELKAQEEKTKQYLIFGGVGLVILIIICFMFFMMFKGK